jgi:hypothetical protein
MKPTASTLTRIVVAMALLLAASSSNAGIISAVSLADMVERAEQILVVEVLEPVDGATPCWLTFGFRYRVERTLRGATAVGAEDLFTSMYPRGDATREECPTSRSFEAYYGDVRPPFEQGQKLILFLGERMPQYTYESVERLAEVEGLVGTTATVTVTPAGPETTTAAPLESPTTTTTTTTPSNPAEPEGGVTAQQAPPTTTTTTITTTTATPQVLESEGRVVEAGTTDLVFQASEEGVAVVGAASAIAGGPGAPGGPIACRTPCRLRVPNGSYLFRVGNEEFAIAATGGTQTWQVDQGNESARLAGEHLTYDGIGALIGGAIFLAAELGGQGGSETSYSAIMGYALMGLGTVSLGIGIPLWAVFGGSAELVSAEEGGGGVGLLLAPGPVAYEPTTGSTFWGLGLAASF